MARLFILADIAAAGGAAVGDRQPTQAEKDAITAILTPCRSVVLRRVRVATVLA